MNTIEMVIEKLKTLGQIKFSNLEGGVARAFGNYEFEGESYIRVTTADNKNFQAFVDHENAPRITFEIEHTMDSMINISNVRKA